MIPQCVTLFSHCVDSVRHSICSVGQLMVKNVMQPFHNKVGECINSGFPLFIFVDFVASIFNDVKKNIF